MNFTLQLYEPSDAETEMWGRKTPNGTYSGILGEMVMEFSNCSKYKIIPIFKNKCFLLNHFYITGWWFC